MKVGDKVIYFRGGYGIYLPKIKTIERETKLYFIIENQKFSKKDLHSIGDSWHFDRIEEFDECKFKRIYDENFPKVALRSLPHLSWKDYSDEFLRKIFKLCIEENKRNWL